MAEKSQNAYSGKEIKKNNNKNKEKTIQQQKGLPTLSADLKYQCLNNKWVRYDNRGRLLLRTPDPVPFGTCICSNVLKTLSCFWTLSFKHRSVFLFYLLRLTLNSCRSGGTVNFTLPCMRFRKARFSHVCQTYMLGLIILKIYLELWNKILRNLNKRTNFRYVETTTLRWTR